MILHLLREPLEHAEAIADVGTGTGIMKGVLEEHLRKKIIGFELDIAFVVERHGVVGADACRLPVPDARFDLVILNHLYEHVDDQGGLFREAWRVVRPGGAAYVSAGSRHAVLEPHYRLPFLSWLPRPAADAYLRATGRGRSYQGIRFRSYGELTRLMEEAGFRVRDLTERAIRELVGRDRKGAWRMARAALERLPAGGRAALLRRASPQWFFLLEKPNAPGGDRGSTREDAHG